MKRKPLRFSIFLCFFFLINLLVFVGGCTHTAPVVNFFLAEPNIILEGESSTLSWNVTGADSVTISPDIGSVSLSGTLSVNPSNTTTYTLVATNSTGSVTSMALVTVNPLPAINISQTEGTNKAWFGASPGYVNVGQGQSFEVTEPGFFDKFEIYLTSNQPTNSGDTIICDLRNSNGVILQSVSINGFAPGNGGWQVFDFKQSAYITPGTYYCTCYVKNPLPDHYYNCHGNGDDNSYPAGKRYYSTGGNPGDWNTWNTYPTDAWDLLFKVKIILPAI